MDFKVQIATFEQLAAVDADLDALQIELDTEKAGLSGKHSQARTFEEKLARNREMIADMERQRGESVQEVRQMSLQIDRSREKLSRCRTEREANAVQREFEELRKLQRDREHEIGKIDELHEQARQDIETTEAELQSLREDLGETSGDLETKLQGLEQQLVEKKAVREQLLTAIDKVLYRRYEQIRKRRGTALSHTTDGRCVACNILLPPMMFQKLRREGTIEQCPQCNRLIFFKIPTEADAGASEPSAATE